MAEPPAEPETATGRATLLVAGRRVELEFEVPAGPSPEDAILPLARRLADDVVRIAADDAAKEGLRVSCRAGCGACCRQLVPVAPVEARRLAAVVEELPEPRRAAVRERFAAARRRLADAGVLARLSEGGGRGPEERQRTGVEYVRLGIACPFLEDDRCGIYEERPLSCREYLVTSPPEACAAPSAATVRMVPLPVRVSNALGRLRARDDARWVPLVLALDYAAARPAPPPSTGPDRVRAFLDEVLRL